MMDQVTDILYVVGFIQGLLIGGFLLINKAVLKSARLLGVFVLFISYECFSQSTIVAPEGALYWINNGNLFLYGPLLLLFIQGTRLGLFPARGVILLHLLPFIIIKSGTLVFGPTGLGESVLPGWFLPALNVLLTIHGITYAAWSVYEASRGKWKSAERVNMWIFRLSVVYALGWIFSILAKNFEAVSPVFSQSLWALAYISLVVIIYLISLEFMVVPRFFQLGTAGKYKKSSLRNEQLGKLETELKNALVSDKVFLDPDLNRSDLSRHLGITPHQLSQLLNNHMDTDFYALIQNYRVEEVKKRLSDPAYSHYSILAVAMDCGFTTKSTFNRVFKQFTGQTPSEYFKQVTS